MRIKPGPVVFANRASRPHRKQRVRLQNSVRSPLCSAHFSFRSGPDKQNRNRQLFTTSEIVPQKYHALETRQETEVPTNRGNGTFRYPRKLVQKRLNGLTDSDCTRTPAMMPPTDWWGRWRCPSSIPRGPLVARSH